MSNRDMLWERTDKSIIDDVRRQSQATRRLTREEFCDRVMAVYRGDFDAIVDEALASMFRSQEAYSWLRLHLHTATNVLRRVLYEVALVYENPATRYLKGAAGEDAAGRRATLTGEIGSLLTLSDEALAAVADEEPEEKPAAPEDEGPSPTAGGEAEPGAPGADPVEAAARAEASKPEAQTALDRLLAKVDVDGVMEEAHRLGLVLPALWIMPVVREDPTPADPSHVRLDFDIHTPVTSGVEPDPKDPTQAAAFYTVREEKRENGQTRRVKYRWTADRFEKYEVSDSTGRDTKVQNDLAPDEVNKLKRLPVTVVRLGRPLDSYYLDGQGQDLYDATIEVAVLRTLQNARYRDSSFKQLAIDGNPEDLPAEQVVGLPFRPIYTREGSVSVLDMQANLQAMSDVVRERLEDIIVAYGISPAQWSMSEKAQSGFSKKMDQAKVAARNRRERKYLAAAERDLYALTALVLQNWPVADIGALDPKGEFVIDFAEPDYEEDPLTQAKADSLAVKMNLASYLDLVMRENPDLTAKEALATLALNMQINRRFTPGGSSRLMDVLSSVSQSELAFERMGGKKPGGGGPPEDGGEEDKPGGGGRPPPPRTRGSFGE